MITLYISYIVGAVFFLGGIALLVKQVLNRKNNTASASAQVIGYEEKEQTDHTSDTVTTTVIYYPIVRYYAAGRYYEQKGSTGSGNKKYSLGENVNIKYNPDAPEQFMFEGQKTEWIMAGVAILIGCGVLALAILGN